jgi:hypothetical protein
MGTHKIMPPKNITLSGKKNLHYILKDSDSKIFNKLHDIAYLGLSDCQQENINGALDGIDICRNDNEIAYYLLNYCFDNFLFASKWLLNIDILPFQGVVLRNMWDRKFPYILATRGAGKSFLYAVFALLRALLIPGSQIVIVSNSFRQSKLVFDFVRKIYDGSPILRQIACPNEPRNLVDCNKFTIGTSSICAIPIGDGSSIRGLRSNCTLVDEFASINEEIFKIVIWGFAAVAQMPDERVRAYARRDSNWIGYSAKEKEYVPSFGNQIILAGTANFTINHSFRWYQNYIRIIKTRGDKQAIKSLFGIDSEDVNVDMFDWRDFGIITLPYEFMPKGFMDDTIITNARINMPEEVFDMEYRCKFLSDTKGFIPMSMIKNSTDGEVQLSSNDICFLGIDPARSNDNLAIVIGKLEDNVGKIIYCFSFNEKRLEEEFNCGDLPKLGFYFLACMKIFSLVKRFNVKSIYMDEGGGGSAIADILKTPYLSGIPHDMATNPIVTMDCEDALPNSSRILILQKFGTEFITNSNYTFKKDIEIKELLFPEPNLAKASNNMPDKIDFINDDYDFINQEIEKMKMEIASIKVYESQGGAKRFDTGKGGSKPKKDRYTGAFLANCARRAYLEGLLKEEDDITYFSSPCG